MTLLQFWWILAAVLICAELMSGALYLLVLGVAAALAGVVAYAVDSWVLQAFVAIVGATIGVLTLKRWKKRHMAHPKMSSNLELGQSVTVEVWQPDGTAKVYYRGAHWQAEKLTPETPQQQVMYIANLRGNTLVLTDSTQKN